MSCPETEMMSKEVWCEPSLALILSFNCETRASSRLVTCWVMMAPFCPLDLVCMVSVYIMY